MESNFEWITANGDIGIRFFHSIDDGGYGPVNFQTPEYVDYLDAADYAHDMIGNLNAGMNRLDRLELPRRQRRRPAPRTDGIHLRSDCR